MEAKGNGQEDARLPNQMSGKQQKPTSINIQDASTTATSTLTAPLTPRIDISRASSSSYHEDSSPENVFEQVGTGTLQEATGCLGFTEEGALELRSSTEELFFMEPDKGQEELEKPTATQIHRPPMIFKFDEAHSNIQQMYHRKDSGSSEVAAFLNISGRTSRISSVGSQGSAVSRLSGVSGISRSPSPHKMLVETSFCGPKPIEQTTSDASSVELTADVLENVILARRRDPTEVVLAEGVDINLNQTKETTKISTKSENPIKEHIVKKEKAADSNPNSNPNPRKKPLDPEKLKEVRAIKARLNEINARKLAAAAEAKTEKKKVVGVTPSGTEYIRIKLKPDHLYPDQGLSPNERVIDDSEFKESKKKEREKEKDHISSMSTSLPHQPTHHNESNRSPSPASTSVSRKSSFCSFFKSKDSNLNTEHTTKKRSASATSSTSKGKLDKSPLPSPKSTPGESKELLQESTPTSGGKPRLRYYDSNTVVHIPLHTPPEEKDLYGSSKTRSKYEAREEQAKQESVTVTSTVNDTVVKPPPPPPPMRSFVSELESKFHANKSKQPPEVQMRPKMAPTAHLETIQSTDDVDDGPVKSIPLGSSTTEDADRDHGASASLWSVEVQRHDSNDSGVTVISSQNFNSNEDTARNSVNSLKNGTIERTTITTTITTTATMATATCVATNNAPQQPLSAKGRHKRHLLFSTKIGSGSEEQIFSTQLSLSKTESQSSQLSEQASALGSPKSDEQQQQQKTKPPPPPEIITAITKRDKSTETVGRSRSRDSKLSHESGGSASDTRSKRDSMEFGKKRDSSEASKKRDSMEPIKKRSSDESLKKKRDSTEIQSPHSRTSPVQSLPPHSHTHHGIHRHSHRLPESTNKMEISSESERESDIDSAAIKRISRSMEDHESTGLVLQESFDDELPYVPTTLPEERTTGLRIVPVKERTHIELKTIPVERPRSTTPINPASLDNYCERKMSECNESNLVRGEKLRISLPRKKSEASKENTQQKVLTKRTSNLSNKSWTEFAEQNLQGTTAHHHQTNKPSVVVPDHATTKPQDPPFPPDTDDFPPPALPPRKPLSKSQWIDFENIPEKRQPPKKITTLPTSKDGEKNHSGKSTQRIHYNYVAPEECQCECHESKRGDREHHDSNKQSPAESANAGKTPQSEDSQPLLDEVVDRNSMMSTDSSMDCSLDNEDNNGFLLQQQQSTFSHAATQSSHKSSTSNNNLDKPFGMDLSVELGAGHSNRSSIVSQDIKSPDMHHKKASSEEASTKPTHKK